MQVRIALGCVKQCVLKAHAGKDPEVQDRIVGNRQLITLGLQGTQRLQADRLTVILAFADKTMALLMVCADKIDFRAFSPPAAERGRMERDLSGKVPANKILAADMLKGFSGEFSEAGFDGYMHRYKEKWINVSLGGLSPRQCRQAFGLT